MATWKTSTAGSARSTSTSRQLYGLMQTITGKAGGPAFPVFAFGGIVRDRQPRATYPSRILGTSQTAVCDVLDVRLVVVFRVQTDAGVAKKSRPQGRLFSSLALSACFLVILSVDLEVCLRVVADGANVGGLGAYDDVTAVAAFPHLDLALLEHLGGFDIVQ